MLLSVNDKVYQMGEKTAKAVLKLAHDSRKGTNTIYALEKPGKIFMVDMQFVNLKELKKAAKLYIKQGFKVRYTMA